MSVQSTQASRFVRTDGRSRALVDSRLVKRSDDEPGTENSTNWLENWGSRLERLRQLKAMGLLNGCPACWGQQAWRGATTNNGRVSALYLRGVPGENEDLGSALGQSYSLETGATWLG